MGIAITFLVVTVTLLTSLGLAFVATDLLLVASFHPEDLVHGTAKLLGLRRGL